MIYRDSKGRFCKKPSEELVNVRMSQQERVSYLAFRERGKTVSRRRLKELYKEAFNLEKILYENEVKDATRQAKIYGVSRLELEDIKKAEKKLLDNPTQTRVKHLTVKFNSEIGAVEYDSM